MTRRSSFGVVAALVMAVASPVLAKADATPNADTAGKRSGAVHLDPLPWNAPWSQDFVAEASGSPAPWEFAPHWLPLASRSGLLIAVDPVSGRRVRPTPEQRRALSDLLGSENTPDLPAERLSRGGEVVHLNGRFQIFSIARRDASGRLVLDCVSDPADAARPVPVSASTRPRAEER
jgi:hypothetical protein